MPAARAGAGANYPGGGPPGHKRGHCIRMAARGRGYGQRLYSLVLGGGHGQSASESKRERPMGPAARGFGVGAGAACWARLPDGELTTAPNRAAAACQWMPAPSVACACAAALGLAKPWRTYRRSRGLLLVPGGARRAEQGAWRRDGARDSSCFCCI